MCIAIRDQALVDLGVRLEDFRWWVCIAIRDQALVDLGVRLEDRPDGGCALQWGSSKCMAVTLRCFKRVWYITRRPIVNLEIDGGCASYLGTACVCIGLARTV